MKKKSGQVIVIFAFLCMAMFMFMLLVVNVSTLSKERLKLQKAADAAALAMATYQARAFNAISDKNFILKYPSGDTSITHEIGNQDSYSVPGIDQIALDTGYKFISRSEFNNYIELIAPHQDQQDRFIRVYTGLIPQIGKQYLLKNDENAALVDFSVSKFQFVRDNEKIEYRDWDQSAGTDTGIRQDVPTWMYNLKSDMTSSVTVSKTLNIWGRKFIFEAVASSNVQKDTGEIWPEPKPEYKAILTVTKEKGVLH